MESAEWAKNCPRREGIKLNYHLHRLHFGDEQTPQARRGFFTTLDVGMKRSRRHTRDGSIWGFAMRLQLSKKKTNVRKKEREECRRVRQTLGRGVSLYLFFTVSYTQNARDFWAARNRRGAMGQKRRSRTSTVSRFFCGPRKAFLRRSFPLKSYRSFFLILLFFLCPIAFQVRERGKGGKLTALASASAAEASEGNKTSASPPPLLPHFRR